jgi:hypothetical protein
MRMSWKIALASAAIGMATQATAAATVTTTNGTPLSYQIFGIKSTGNPVFGSSPDNTNVPNVTYTANSATTMDIKNGFAAIDDADSKNPSFFELIINPDLDFTAMKFAFQLTADADVQVYYLLANSGLSANLFSNYTLLANTESQKTSDDTNYLLSGDVFDAMMIKVTTPNAYLFEFKQNSYDPALVVNPLGGVPEPATWAMMLLGFAGIGAVLRRSRRRNPELMQLA